ncbi:MAG: hypothetical protein JO323_19140 [Acidobacteriia bacterium]|nr:hypothetical protein [Terriglobia bacterium]
MSSSTQIPEIPGAQEPPAPIIIDFGRRSRKSVKRLRRGIDGSLMRELNNTVQQMREEGSVSALSQTVVVVVRERSRRRRFGLLW